MRLVRRIVGQRDAGADADVEDAPADPLGRRDRGLAAGVEHRAEDEIVDRRPARIGLRDRVLMSSLARHRPQLARYALMPSYIRTGVRPRARFARVGSACAAATALWMKPPPSTRAWPSGAS